MNDKQVPLTDAQKQAVYDAVTEALGDAYDCLRVWSAWGYGNMSENDFRLVSEDGDRVAEIADAAIAALSRTAPPSCGACPGDGTICSTTCKVADESPPAQPAAQECPHGIFGSCPGCDSERFPFPQRDASKPSEAQGVFHKFHVLRVDGSSEPGGTPRDLGKAQALAKEFANVTAAPADQALGSPDVVIAATAYADVVPALKSLGDLTGKVVVDITNALTPDYMGLTVGHSTSAAEEIAKAMPGAQVVKAFNTVFAQILADGPELQGKRVPVFYATDRKQAGADEVLLIDEYDVPPQAKMQAAGDVNRALEEGWRGLPIAARFPLDDIASAHEFVERPTRAGRVILTL